ncbi:MAG: glycoside hydrolase, partial [Candidatus Latescibacteria bacterium]|nr:glycoside hydrolase [Candidatus Latescibacterota bacterium]
MSAPFPLFVVFVWHMHQPYYRDVLTGECLLPWTRLHGLKDYYDIPAIGAEFPEVHQTFNLVPSLIVQLEEYASQGKSDAFLDAAARPADRLTMDDRLFLLRNFFMANTDTMITPYPRYKQLLDRRGQYGTFDEVSNVQERFQPQDFLDLQVWFHLAWTGQTLKERPEVQRLFTKGLHFTEEEKQTLLRVQREFLGEIIPFYRRLQDAGQVEVSLSPFYHPILPLLCDSFAAAVALPGLPLPSSRFAHSEDARTQVRRGVECYQQRFGRAPAGMWPSEGSVSPDIIPIVAEAGLAWIASDDEILTYSLAPSTTTGGAVPVLTPTQRYRPYRVGEGDQTVTLLFRDHLLSDRIGFIYSRWDAEDAAADFVGRLLEIRRQLPPSPPFIVPIILDGENAWEFYANHGEDFLRALYTKVARTPELRAVTVSEALDAAGPTEPLERLFSGSWIGHSFATWIGHPEKNAGWECLDAARHALIEHDR